MTRNLNEYPYVEAIARFKRDTADHVMAVLHDDGLYRHLLFQGQKWQPPLLEPVKRSCYWFELLTAPGSLTFQGDGDSFVFRRIEDMFEFFRQPGGAPINPGYWGEKLTVPGGRDSVMNYQQEMLTNYLDETVAEAIKEDPVKLAGLTEAVRDRITDEMVGNESIDRQLVDKFSFWTDTEDQWAYPPKRPDFEFVDTFDVGTRDYDWWFLWACNAIVWGIRKYDGRERSESAA